LCTTLDTATVHLYSSEEGIDYLASTQCVGAAKSSNVALCKNPKEPTKVPDVGFRKWLGLNYEKMSDEQAIVSIDLDEDKMNVRGVAHGGIVASLVDVAMGTAAGGGNYDTRKRLVATQELKVNYLTGAKGNRLTATATVVRAGSRSIVVSCEVVTDTGLHCATALGTFMTRRVAEGDPDRFHNTGT
jgi:acyl-CoA thioesterase